MTDQDEQQKQAPQTQTAEPAKPGAVTIRDAPAVPGFASKNEIGFGAAGADIGTFEDLFRFAQAVSRSNLFPNAKTAEQALVIMQAGREFGLSLIASMQSFYVLEPSGNRPGAVVMEARAMKAVALAARVVEDIEETQHFDGPITDWSATCRVKRRDRKSYEERTFSWGDATKAGLTNRDNWTRHPKDMLIASALRKCMRHAIPDVLKGIRTAEDVYEERGSAPQQDAHDPATGEVAPPEGDDPLLIEVEVSDGV